MKRRTIVKISLITFLGAVSVTLLLIVIAGAFAGENTGLADAGMSIKQEEADPEVPSSCVLLKNDTLKSIADSFKLNECAIARLNGIEDGRKLHAGDRIELPKRKKTTARTNRSSSRLEVEASRIEGIAPLHVSFSASMPLPRSVASLAWAFGDGRYAFGNEQLHTYLEAGLYRVVLCGFSESGEETDSAVIEIRVASGNLKTKGLNYITLNSIGSVLDLDGAISGFFGSPFVFNADNTVIRQNPVLLDQIGDNRFIAVAGGYAIVTLESANTRYTFDLFVSPFPTQHSVEPGYDWYKTQFETGIWGNCGPACVAMAVHWATGENITVEKSREEIGMPYPKGALTYDNMLSNLKLHGITAFKKSAIDFKDIKDVIDRGRIAIILFDTTFIRPVRGEETRIFTDRYYPDTTGHYVIIKGYTLDEKYFVVYDPIPGNWKDNSPRYTDGVSMIGRNRYFLADEIFDSIRGKDVVVVCRR